MPTFTQNFYHAVFSTKNREPLIAPELELRLYPFIGGIVRDLHCTLIAVGGMPDHLHILVRYRPDLSHSDLLEHIKGRLTKWIGEEFPELGFAWQAGYGGFTVSKSAVPEGEAYIARQKVHHATQDFRTEFLMLLRRHEVEFDVDEVFE